MGGGGWSWEQCMYNCNTIWNSTYIIQISLFATPFSPDFTVSLAKFEAYVSLVKQHITTFLGSPGDGVKPPDTPWIRHWAQVGRPSLCPVPPGQSQTEGRVPDRVRPRQKKKSTRQIRCRCDGRVLSILILLVTRTIDTCDTPILMTDSVTPIFLWPLTHMTHYRSWSCVILRHDLSPCPLY